MNRTSSGLTWGWKATQVIISSLEFAVWGQNKNSLEWFQETASAPVLKDQVQTSIHPNTESWQSQPPKTSSAVAIEPDLHASLPSSPVAQLVKNLPIVQEIWAQSLGWEDPLENGKATPLQYSGLENFRTLQSMGSQRVGHNWVSFFYFHFAIFVYEHKDKSFKKEPPQSTSLISQLATFRLHLRLYAS